MNKQQDSDTDVHTDIMNKHLTVLMRDYEREVAKWTFVYGMLSEQQRKAFHEWKTKRMNMEINEIISDDSSEEDENEEGTEDDESDMSCSS